MRKAADYIYWLRNMAERETMNVRPCPKALRRAADCFEELESKLAEIAGLPIIWMEVERLMRKRGLITEADAIASCIAELQASINMEKSDV